jgi:short-subunit dehydrogenase
MKILITGTSSGIGKELLSRLQDHTVVAPTRQQLDLSNIASVAAYDPGVCDMLINCAGTDCGGKIDFANHQTQQVVDILNVNLVAPVILSKHALAHNAQCKIVNVTSTNNNRYYADNLCYSLSKKALAEFGTMLKVDYPAMNYLEIRMGLTKTNFNQNRYSNNPDRFVDIYQNKHLTVAQAVDAIVPAIFDSSIKFLEVAP